MSYAAHGVEAVMVHPVHTSVTQLAMLRRFGRYELSVTEDRNELNRQVLTGDDDAISSTIPDMKNTIFLAF